jgi:hypothetical protein
MPEYVDLNPRGTDIFGWNRIQAADGYFAKNLSKLRNFLKMKSVFSLEIISA